LAGVGAEGGHAVAAVVGLAGVAVGCAVADGTARTFTCPFRTADGGLRVGDLRHGPSHAAGQRDGSTSPTRTALGRRVTDEVSERASLRAARDPATARWSVPTPRYAASDPRRLPEPGREVTRDLNREVGWEVIREVGRQWEVVGRSPRRTPLPGQLAALGRQGHEGPGDGALRPRPDDIHGEHRDGQAGHRLAGPMIRRLVRLGGAPSPDAPGLDGQHGAALDVDQALLLQFVHGITQAALARRGGPTDGLGELAHRHGLIAGGAQRVEDGLLSGAEGTGGRAGHGSEGYASGSGPPEDAGDAGWTCLPGTAAGSNMRRSHRWRRYMLTCGDDALARTWQVRSRPNRLCVPGARRVRGVTRPAAVV
jgi:hypothetical protein